MQAQTWDRLVEIQYIPTVLAAPQHSAALVLHPGLQQSNIFHCCGYANGRGGAVRCTYLSSLLKWRQQIPSWLSLNWIVHRDVWYMLMEMKSIATVCCVGRQWEVLRHTVSFRHRQARDWFPQVLFSVIECPVLICMLGNRYKDKWLPLNGFWESYSGNYSAFRAQVNWMWETDEQYV